MTIHPSPIQGLNSKSSPKITETLPGTVVRSLSLYLSLTLLTGCISFGVKSGEVFVDQPVMARGVDEQSNPVAPTTIFKTTDKRIYCTISTRGPDNIRLGARWYYGDKLISDKIIDFGTQRRGSWWLEVALGILLDYERRWENLQERSPSQEGSGYSRGSAIRLFRILLRGLRKRNASYPR